MDGVDLGDERVAASGPLDRLAIELDEFVSEIVLTGRQRRASRADHSVTQWGEVVLRAD